MPTEDRFLVGSPLLFFSRATTAASWAGSIRRNPAALTTVSICSLQKLASPRVKGKLKWRARWQHDRLATFKFPVCAVKLKKTKKNRFPYFEMIKLAKLIQFTNRKIATLGFPADEAADFSAPRIDKKRDASGKSSFGSCRRPVQCV